MTNESVKPMVDIKENSRVEVSKSCNHGLEESLSPLWRWRPFLDRKIIVIGGVLIIVMGDVMIIRTKGVMFIVMRKCSDKFPH